MYTHKNILCSIVPLLLCTSILQAQEKPRSNALFTEIGKSGLVFNLGYDHKFANGFGLRVVGGTNLKLSFEVKTAGGGLYYLAGKNKKHLEAGIDFYYLYTYVSVADVRMSSLNYFDEANEGLYATLNVGYRMYGKKTMFRVGLSPGIMEGDFVPGGYISYGIRF